MATVAMESDALAGAGPAGGCSALDGWRDFRFGWWNHKYIKHAVDGAEPGKDSTEATGFVMVGASRGSMIGFLAVFSVLGLTGLGESVQDCDTKSITIAGVTILTSSLVSTALTVEGALNAVVAPFVGGLADASSHRTRMLRALSIMLMCSVAICALALFFPGEKWALVTFTAVLVSSSILYDAMSLILNAYLSELSDDDSERVLITTKMYAWLNLTQLSYVVLGVSATLAVGVSDDKLASPQVGAFVAVLVWAFWALPGMRLFYDRVRSPDEIKKMGFLGLPRMYEIVMLCFRQYPQVALYMLMYSTGVTAASSVIGLALTYLLEEVGLGTFTIQLVAGVVLLSAFPGALAVIWFDKWLRDTRKTLLIVFTFWIVSISMVPFILHGEVDPDPGPSEAEFCALEDDAGATRRPTAASQYTAFLFAVLVGLGIGALFPTAAALFSQIVPVGQEASFWGLRTFAAKVFSWAPPAIYTVLNQKLADESGNPTDSSRFVILAIVPILGMGLWTTWMIDMDKAKAQIGCAPREGVAGKDGKVKDAVLTEELSVAKTDSSDTLEP